MELDGIEKKSLKSLKDNKAFESEERDQIYIDVDSSAHVDSAADVADDDHKMTDEHKCLPKKILAFQGYLAERKDQIRLIIYLVLAAGFVAIVIAACVLNFHRAVGLLVIALVTVFFLFWDWLMERYGDWVWEELSPIRDLLSRNWFWIRCIMYALLLVAVVCWLALDTAQRGTRQLVSFFGLLLLIFLMMLFSKHPFRTFLSYTDVGSKFVFGPNYKDHFFVFKVMPILIFLSSVISVLFHIGFMSWLVGKIGFLMQVAMGTSPAESMAAAGNIFLGLTESPLLIRPYIRDLTLSEMHAVMTGGFASIAGTVLGAYISFGVDATHLLTATVMSAPGSLAVAKMFWPETETPSVTDSHIRKINHGDSKNLFDAVSKGASCAVGLVASIVANILSFLAVLAFIDAVLSWLGGMLDCPQLSFSLICSYVLMPLSFMMGVSWEDSYIVAELIGKKTFINELVAYLQLSELINRRKAGGPEYVDNVKQYISVHSEAIATYALCGFSSIASLGITIGSLSSLAPDRQNDIASCAFRALIAGSVSNFMTACIAGMLYIPDLPCPHFLSTEFINTNVTSSSQLVTCCLQLYKRCVYVCNTDNFLPVIIYLLLCCVASFTQLHRYFLLSLCSYKNITNSCFRMNTADGEKRYCDSVSVCACIFYLQCDGV
ncbi:solute carrier family 28 member 3-like isoform X2 [Sebastes umbrosus]|uniref:solute carrier family 28 member 3-like isoform X2 n=1 Tax=Sebastes umbrosus TaxID=72105 RepID=UPI00189E1798|nr:solute carrier family 28 member 3-like isoform X2 [Sebastes umbrosus]